MLRRRDGSPSPLSICELARGLELTRLPDDHENVACSELELGVRAPDVVRPAADRQHQGTRAGPEPALGEGLADQIRRAGEANATIAIWGRPATTPRPSRWLPGAPPRNGR